MIPLVDVKAQYAPLIPELKERFAEVLESGRFIFGPEVEAFEREAADYLGVPHAVGVANGTDALVLSLEAMGIGRGDEVVCPAFTFYATAEAIARVGATPVFADIDPATLNLDVDDVARRLTERTKAIMPVHLFGRPAPLTGLAALGLPLIEDSAQAFGAAGIATTGVCSTFSFFPTKNLFGLGDGGLVATDDEELAARVRMLRFHGSRDKVVFELVGYNSRLDELQGLGYAHAGAKNDFGGMTVVDFIAGPSAFEKLKSILMPIIESVGGSITYETLSAHKMFAEAFSFDLQPA